MDLLELVAAFELNDEDTAIYDYILNTKNRVYHYLDKELGVFKLDDLGESYCHTHFRFYKNDIRRLVQVLKLPQELVLKCRVRVSAEEALCILLKRLAYPNRYADLMTFFPRGQSALSAIFNHMVDYICQNFGHVLKNLNQPYLSRERIDQLCDSISRKGAPYKRTFGFIDGTVRAVCRPSHDQREFYNGHKRHHSIKFQSIMLPNGMVHNMFGSVVGRRHDGHLLARSKVVQKIEQKFHDWDDPPYLYGDSGYPLSKVLIVPFKGASLSRAQQKVNKKMSAVRVTVEWGFAKILQLFPFIDFKKNLKIRKQSVPKFYKVATILTNCHTCLYGSQVCQYFELDPPTLDDYLN